MMTPSLIVIMTIISQDLYPGYEGYKSWVSYRVKELLTPAGYPNKTIVYYHLAGR